MDPLIVAEFVFSLYLTPQFCIALKIQEFRISLQVGVWNPSGPIGCEEHMEAQRAETRKGRCPMVKLMVPALAQRRSLSCTRPANLATQGGDDQGGAVTN